MTIDYDDMRKRAQECPRYEITLPEGAYGRFVSIATPQTIIALLDSIAALREQVAAKDAENARLLHLINMDWDCLPTCDSFGHDPECPYCNGEPKLRLLAERAEKAEGLANDLFGKVSAVNDRILKAEADNAALQAKIDSLMLEYCPDEMTDEQRSNWAKHQALLAGDANSKPTPEP